MDGFAVCEPGFDVSCLVISWEANVVWKWDRKGCDVRKVSTGREETGSALDTGRGTEHGGPERGRRRCMRVRSEAVDE